VQLDLEIDGGADGDHEVVWERWNGAAWVSLGSTLVDGTVALRQSGRVTWESGAVLEFPTTVDLAPYLDGPEAQAHARLEQLDPQDPRVRRERHAAVRLHGGAGRHDHRRDTPPVRRLEVERRHGDQFDADRARVEDRCDLDELVRVPRRDDDGPRSGHVMS
jgi:hypothetical protein